MEKIKIELNNEKNGVEIYFGGKPSESIREDLKENGFRWSRYNKCWYAKQSEKTLQFAESLQGKEIEVEKVVEKVKNDTNLSLWERTRVPYGLFEDISIEEKQKMYGYRFKGVNSDQTDIVKIAKEIRKHLKDRFKEIKFSVTSDRRGGSSLHIDIVSSPYKKDSDEFKAILDYVKEIANSYNYDKSDNMTDYYDFNFYLNITSWNTIEIDPTDEQLKDMEDFRENLEIEKEKLRIESRKEFEKFKKEREETEKVQNEIRIEREKNLQTIIENIEEIELEDEYFVKNAISSKESGVDSTKEYKKSIENGELTRANLIVRKEIHFKNREAFELFSEQLLSDYEFLVGIGGAYTGDFRINGIDDYIGMSDEERDTVEFLEIVVALIVDDQIEMLVNSEGRSYVDTAFFIDDFSIISKEYDYKNSSEKVDIEYLKNLKRSARDIENLCKDVKDQKISMDIIMDCENTIREDQIPFSKAIIQQVEDLDVKTLAYEILNTNIPLENQIERASLDNEDYLTVIIGTGYGELERYAISLDNIAKDDDWCLYGDRIELSRGEVSSVKIPLTKHKIAIYKGVYDIPDTVYYDIEHFEGMTTTKSKFSMIGGEMDWFDATQEYINEKYSALPVINTFKPVF